MQASSQRIYGQVIYLAATVLATVFALSCLWEIELESWTMRVLGIRYEPSFEAAERWRFILTSTGFAAIALIVPSIWVARSLRIQRDGYRALKREQAKREELARHDPLTGLFNRRLFNEHLAAALDNKGSATAIFLIGLDRFKRINDAYGHAVGDKVLCEIAERLREISGRSAACVARTGGDEFALIVCDDNRRALTALANDILTALCAPIAFLERSTSVGATVGISVAHVDAVQPDTLIHCAEHAMSRGKSGARATFHFYDPSYEQAQQQASQFENDLLLAVAHEHIEPFFQPIVSLPEQRIVGFEILARWPCPHRGLQMPMSFIPVLDHAGRVPEMTFSLLKKSIAYAKDWPQELMLAINVTASMLEDTGFADRLHEAIAGRGFAPTRLEIEITEQALVSDITAVRENLLKLRSRGIGVALDDFGTGYSGIYHLTHLAIDKIKIDRSFLDRNIEGHEKVVAAVLGLANSLHIKVTAEGIEDEDVIEWLCAQNCDFAQGYLFGEPMPADQVARVLNGLHAFPGPLRSNCGSVQMS